MIATLTVTEKINLCMVQSQCATVLEVYRSATFVTAPTRMNVNVCKFFRLVRATKYFYLYTSVQGRYAVKISGSGKCHGLQTEADRLKGWGYGVSHRDVWWVALPLLKKYTRMPHLNKWKKNFPRGAPRECGSRSSEFPKFRREEPGRRGGRVWVNYWLTCRPNLIANYRHECRA